MPPGDCRVELTLQLDQVYQPTPKQQLAHSASARFLLYGGAVGGGKTIWLVNEVLQLSLDFPGNAGLICRNELSSFKRTTFIALEKYFPKELIRLHHRTEAYYDLLNGSRIYYGGLQEGFERLKSAEFGWAGIDQVEEVEEATFLMLASRLRLRLPDGRYPHYRMLCTANPDQGWVRSRWIERALPDHLFIPALPRDNPHLPPGYEENLRQLYPPALAQALLDGDWDAMGASNYLIAYRDISAAVNRVLPDDGDSVFGIDVAWEGADRTVCAWRKGPVVKKLWVWRGLDEVQLTTEIAPLMNGIRPQAVNVDAIGIGAGLYANLLHKKDWEPSKGPDGKDIAYQPIIGAVKVSESAMDSEYYYNQAAENYCGLQKRFHDGAISIPDDPELKGELAAWRADLNNRGQIQLESKDKLKVSLGRSPDIADALMLAFAPIRKTGGIWI